MGEISLDASTVSRFIVSLSKSIQALCHGCMDFDDSIEMVGYININIDSGKTVDCVLNEKVHKSAANAMTCISNSFHAKKEKPKQTKDGSCSPIPETEYSANQVQPYKRSYTNFSDTHHGLPRKKHRYHAKPVLPYSEHHATPDSIFHEQQSATTSSRLSNPEQHVKAETHDSAPSEYDNFGSTSSENLLVKEELQVSDTQDAHDNIDNSMLDPSFQTNMPGQSHDLAQDSTESNFHEKQENVEQYENESVEPEPSFLNTASGVQDTHTDDNQQPHGSQEDAGDDDQFEVIEIGDDDEDVHGLFDASSATMMRHHEHHNHQQMMTANALYLSAPEYLTEMEREKKKHLAKLYRLNRTSEQRERDRRLARMRQRRRRAKLRDQSDQEQ